MSAFLFSVTKCSSADRRPQVERCVRTLAAGVAAVAILGAQNAWAGGVGSVSLGEDVFKAQCAACHMGGGNIIPYARGKNLKETALKKYKMDSVEAIVNLTKKGKGAMPKYEGKLDEEQLEAVAQFVLERAKAGWSK
mmetsp:Transcript_3314/g.10122  ORF Transcript_3314/g.10122 Transcript_3314/m.10122 type:complete len:137 (+) Transcript_3314:439-849(+)